MLFKDKKLWNVVSRTNVKLLDNFAKWEKRDMKAKTIIVMGMHDFMLQNVIGAKTSKETWDCLLKVYEIKGIVNKLFLRRQLLVYKMSPINNMLEHINKIKSLAQ